MKQAEWLLYSTVYSLDVRSFQDGDGDGLGDLQGLISRLDYLKELGIDCLWLAPFFSSKELDGGYDVMDYYRIDPALGSMEDFRVLIHEAGKRGQKIVLDLVVNHTSIHHPWFQRAITDPNSIFYEYYIWKKERPRNHRVDVMFPTVEDSNWAYVEEVDAYYYHTFYHHQADLNMTNPLVQQEILRILDFWMGMGILGFRVDAVPKILKTKGGKKWDGDPYDLLNVWRDRVQWHDSDAVLLGEADVDHRHYPNFLNDGKLTALFNFYGNNYTFLSFAREQAAPLEHALRELPLNQEEYYLNFLRNHDELELGMLEKEEQREVFQVFAPSESMRVYDRGIRRRLPPMFGNDVDRTRMAKALLLSLPGTPVLRYGEEIGMGDDLNLPERRSVRTAMQWSTGPNAGFSDITPQALRYALIREGEFGYPKVNVADQQTDSTSLLHMLKGLLAIRRKWIEWFAHGSFSVLPVEETAVLGYSYLHQGAYLVIVVNLAGRHVDFHLASPLPEGAQLSVLARSEKVKANMKHDRMEMSLPRYGYSWLMVERRDA